jgi:ubiquinone/menaquinone biosynthesis C-methylase UbiE
MTSVRSVHDYWQAQPCGTNVAESQPGSREYYDEIEKLRYRQEPFIHNFAAFPRWDGKRVLEIGVGAGTDFINFARAGAVLTGIDLTPAAVEHARERLALEDLDAEVLVANAESMPFQDASFDLVYSWGVIHHAPNPPQVVREVRRLLAPGGQARIMLYGRHSWNAYRLWLRNALAAGRPTRSLSDVIANHVESEGTAAYTRNEIKLLFEAAGFVNVAVQGFLTPYDLKSAGPLARSIRRDWFLGVIAS